MKQYNPFPDVSSARGAPMGRRGDNSSHLQDAKRLHARRQGGGDGYDKGGAYWGCPANVWGVWSRVEGEIVCCYVRSDSRVKAIEMVREGL